MCLAVPGRILSTDGDGLERTGRVSFGGVVKTVALACVPGAAVGDHVVVHAGFALTVLDEAEARAALADLDALAGTGGDGRAEGGGGP